MFRNDLEKTNFIEFDVKQGYLLYIPSYWWYSITYLDDPATYICNFTYSTLINNISNIWDLSIYFLQQQNIKQKPPKTLHEDVSLEVEKQIPIEEENNTTTTKISDLEVDVQTKEVQEKEEEKEEEKEKLYDISSNLTEVKQLPNKENITYTVSSI